MQYIKEYNLALYNKLLALQKWERRRTILQRIVNKAKRKLNLKKLVIPPQEQMDEIIDIACEYMGIDKCDYHKTIEKFNNCGMEIEKNFENQSQTDVFWNNIGKQWLCINIYVQSVLYNTVVPIYTTLRKLPLNNLTVLDYGCGSGVLAILLHRAFKFKKLVLTDIDNYVANFVKFYIAKTNSKEIVWENILEYDSDETFDFVECLDVLEHLENSYEHLMKLDSKVRDGGIMALKIAFECEDKTHLPQAAESFFVKNDGMSYLRRKYERINYFGDGVVSGVYKKLGNYTLLSECGYKEPAIRSLLKKIPMLRCLVITLRKIKTEIKAKISKTAKPKRKMLCFDVHICDHCNLNCKGCTNFCSIAEKRFVDLNILERDFKRLSELTNRKCELNLMGGEPLLHPDIVKIFDIARKYFDCNVQLVTNGILLADQPNEFWQSCRENAVKIVISVYPIKINEEKIIAQAQKYGVILAALDRTEKFSWLKHPLDLSGSQNIEKTYRKCEWGNVCIYLEDGKLDPCGFPLLAKHFNKYFDRSEYKFFEPTEEDYVDIFKTNSLDEILEKLADPIPYCRYCTLNFSHSKWEVSKKSIDEWI